MYYRIFHEEPSLPQMSEEAEVEEAVAKGIDIFSGFRGVNQLPAKYDVEGVMLPRPFKITKIGPVNLFVQDMESSLNFYMNHLGFVVTEETEFNGHRLYFLRSGAEHHSLALFPRALREELGCSSHTTSRVVWRGGGQLQPIAERGGLFEGERRGVQGDAGELHPGIDYAAFAIDPDGHMIQLYYYMEQIGWSGKPRPQEMRRQVPGNWPDTLEPLSDTYVDQVFPGAAGVGEIVWGPAGMFRHRRRKWGGFWTRPEVFAWSARFKLIRTMLYKVVNINIEDMGQSGQRLVENRQTSPGLNLGKVVGIYPCCGRQISLGHIAMSPIYHDRVLTSQ